MVVFTFSAMHSLWIPALAVFTPVALVFVLYFVRIPPSRRSGLLAEPLLGGTFMAHDDSELDVAAEIRTVLNRLDRRTRDQRVKFTLAVEPALAARAEPAAFRQALSDLIEHALRRAPGGAVLVTAGRSGGRVQVAVSDDGLISEEPAAESALRATSQLLALHGGTLEIDNHPGEGMTALMRLPEGRVLGSNSASLAPARSQAAPSPA